MDFHKFLPLFLLLTLSPLIKGELVCPTDPNFLCGCSLEDYSLVFCSFQYNSQQQINDGFAILKETNNVTLPGQMLTFDSVLLSAHTTVRTFVDLTPMAMLNVTDISFSLNQDFNLIVGGTNSTEEVDIAPLRFATRVFEVTRSSIGDESMENILKFVVPDRLEYLLTAGYLGSGQIVTLPNFQRFPNMVEIDLREHKISSLGSGNFKGLHKLKALVLHNNLISQVPEGALDFGAMEEVGKDIYSAFIIGMGNNLLTDESFHVNSGLETLKRETWLSLLGNPFEFLSQEKFEKFLTAHELNALLLDSPSFFCDNRMKWLKDGREEYEPRVFGILCANDPGNTVFNTTLID